MIWADAQQQLRAENDSIVDAGFWSRKSRDVVRDRLERIGADANSWFVMCPAPVMPATALERNRKKSQDALWTDTPAFENLIKSFEPMQPDEDFVRIDATAWRRYRPGVSYEISSSSILCPQSCLAAR
jgi:predicted kinase